MANSKVVYKYVLNAAPVAQVEMPEDAIILTAAEQGPDVCLWALVDPLAPLVRRQIHIYPTGAEVLHYSSSHIATVMTHGGAFVWHLFDGGES